MNGTDLEHRLIDANETYEATRERVEESGETKLRRLKEARREVADVFSRYEARATGTGDFRGFIEFQSQLDDLVSALPADLPYRETFESVEDVFDKRRLNDGDFERARELLKPIETEIERLDDRATARDQLREARRAVEKRIEELEGEIATYGRLLSLSDIDLDAPVADLRIPIEGYNDSVETAFSAYLARASARELVFFLDRTDWFPLVETPHIPANLRSYIENADAGKEPIPKLLEYADYSRSKLDHYVEDADALKRAIATQRTAVERIDATSFQLDWPPRPAATLRFRLREIRGIIGRFAPEETIAHLREVEALTRDPEYERLRRAAETREILNERERERLKSGAIVEDRKEAIEKKEELERALDRYAPTISSS